MRNLPVKSKHPSKTHQWDVLGTADPFSREFFAKSRLG